MIERIAERWIKPCTSWLCHFVQMGAIALYFTASGAVMFLAALGVWWYASSFEPVVESGEGMKPQYEVVEANPNYLKLRWIKLHKTRDCLGEVSSVLYATDWFEPIGTYPLVIGQHPQTIERIFRFPMTLKPGPYRLNLIVTARCNPLFPSRQTVDIPFEIVP